MKTTTATTETTAIKDATTFGIELEFTGITRKKAAKLLHSYLHSNEQVYTHGLGYLVIDQQGREWSIDNDASIIADYSQQNELVTPVLTATDLPTLKGIVEALKKRRCSQLGR